MTRINLPSLALAALALATAWTAPVAAQRDEGQAADGRPTWRFLEGYPPFWPRYYHGTVVHNGRLWMMGGLSVNEWHRDVWSSTDGQNWTCATDKAGWSGRAKFELVSFKDRLWVIGGYTGDNGRKPLTSEVWSSADGAVWTLESTAPWEPRCDFQVEVYNDQLVVMGGHAEWQRLNDVWVSGDGKNWEQVTASAPWAGRSHFSSVVHKGKLLIGSGLWFDYDIHNFGPVNGTYMMHTDVWETTDLRTWTRLEDKAAFGPRQRANWISIGDYIWMLPSLDFQESPTIASFTWVSPDGTNWWEIARHPRPELRFDNRSCVDFLWYDNKVWGIGGAYQNWGYVIYADHVSVFEGDFLTPHNYPRQRRTLPRPQPGEPGYPDRPEDIVAPPIHTAPGIPVPPTPTPLPSPTPKPSE